jgi:hypothetical protein
MTKELVLSIFSREYTWIQNVNDDVKISKYNKNLLNLRDGEIILIPNLGRDVHTFFSHIVKNYNFLSDFTIFSQDWPFDHVENYLEIINGGIPEWNLHAKQTFNGCWFFCTGYEVISCDYNGAPHHKGLPIVPVWNELFNIPFPEKINFTPGGHICLSRDKIRSLPKLYYTKILKILEENPLSPWIIERLEPYIFSDNIKI